MRPGGWNNANQIEVLEQLLKPDLEGNISRWWLLKHQGTCTHGQVSMVTVPPGSPHNCPQWQFNSVVVF